MEFRIIPIFAFLTLALVGSHASLPSETYWRTVLPNTVMPKAILKLLHPDIAEEKSTSVGVGKSGVNVNTKTPSASGTSVNVGKGGVTVGTGKGNSGGVSTGKSGGKTKVSVGKSGVRVSTGHKGKRVYVGVNPGSPFFYKYAASEEQLHNDPNVALFFLKKDLQYGTKMNLYFTKTTYGATFLPQKVAETIPFSSNKFPEILQKLSVKPESEEAMAMKKTIKECEEPGVEGEEKYCATSLESMIDFSTSKLGTNVQVMATEVDKEDTLKQKYTITKGLKKTKGENSVVCHSQTYAYAVFYCHAVHTTETYVVPLVGSDGTKAKAVAVCHKDTSAWNPKHLAFQVLKIKPGTVPICHFLPEDHIVWVSN